MNIPYSVFCNLVTELFNNDRKASKFLETIPTSIRSVFFDNEYIELQHKSIDILYESIFGNYIEDVYWILYEWKPGYTLTIHNQEYIIENLQDFFNYARETMKFSNN